MGPVTADQHKDESIHDSFITGIQSNQIRQRLLENNELDLQTMFNQARSLDIAQKSSITYQTQYGVNATKLDFGSQQNLTSYTAQPSAHQSSTAIASTKTCSYCGYAPHPRFKCPASNAICRKCNRRGHFQSVCRAGQQRIAAAFHMVSTGISK